MMQQFHFEEGEILLINKELGWTSFDVIRKLRRYTGKKTGHAGTLDPLATGLLILCTGKKTKEISRIQETDKEYTGNIFLGAVRPSCDKETDISHTAGTAGITEKQIHAAARSFVGGYEQVPPLFSAKKVGGKRAYDLARQGKEMQLQPNAVQIASFEITGIDLPLVQFKVVCGKGTYIRALARDLGEKLGCGAYLDSLTRTRIGTYWLDRAYTVSELIAIIEESNPHLQKNQ